MYKLALITGASSGLGQALSVALAEQGISLILAARHFEQTPQSAETLLADLTLPEGRRLVLETVRARTPDLVINNAGCGLYGPILSHPLKPFQEMLALNAQAVMEITIESARALKEKNQKGTILNISSAAAFFPYPTFCVYAATKAFVNAFSLGFDTEMRSSGIRILTACPGQIDTPFRSKAARHFPQRPDSITLPVERVVSLLLQQIEKGERLQIIDGRYRWILRLARLLPSALREKIMIHNLKSRYPQVD
jgi:hypothetical protein